MGGAAALLALVNSEMEEIAIDALHQLMYATAAGMAYSLLDRCAEKSRTN